MEKQTLAAQRLGKIIFTVAILLLMTLCVFGNTADAAEDRLYFESKNEDCAALIQEGLYQAAREGKIFEFKVPSNGKLVYKITQSLIIPNGSRIVGNGVTLSINSADPFMRTSRSSRHAEFTIMSEGMATQGTAKPVYTTFTIDGVNFVQHDDTSAKDVPQSILGLEYCYDIAITNCSFVGTSSTQQIITLFDAYSKWSNITLDKCTFELYTDAIGGSVIFRNYKSNGMVAENASITNCKFYNRAGGEILAIYANQTGVMRNIDVRDCEFYQYNSKYNNAAHFVTLGNTGTTTDVVFENNYIEMEGVKNSVIKLAANSNAAKGSVDRIFVRNNVIVAHDVLATGSAVILGDKLNKVTAIENNTITVNTKKGLVKPGIFSSYATVTGNRLYGNGIGIAFNSVRTVTDNYVENCVTAFQGVLVCERNQIDNCSKNMIYINDANGVGKSKSWIDIVIRDNILSSEQKTAITGASSASLYANIIIEGNIITNTNIYLTNTKTKNFLRDNIIYLNRLDDVSTVGTTVEMSGNVFLDLDGNPLITEDSPPKGSVFNRSVPVGAIIEFRSSSDKKVIIGYKKTSAGTDAATWTPVYGK